MIQRVFVSINAVSELGWAGLGWAGLGWAGYLGVNNIYSRGVMESWCHYNDNKNIAYS